MINNNSIDSVQAQIDAILDINRPFNRPLTLEEKKHLKALGDIIGELEKDIEIPDIYGAELLNSLIEDNELTPLDLVPVLGTLPYVESILEGKQELSMDDITNLAEFFHVSPLVFLPRKSKDE